MTAYEMRISDWSSDVCASDLMIHMGIGIDIVQPDPGRRALRGAKLPQLAGQVGHVRANLASLPLARLMPGVDPVSGGVLADDQQFLRSGMHQLFRLAQHGVDAPRSEEHTSELQSLMRLSYAVYCLKKKNNIYHHIHIIITTQPAQIP